MKPTTTSPSFKFKSSKILFISPIIQNCLYFATINGSDVPCSTSRVLYVSFDKRIQYPKILSYFGPPDLGTVYRYTEILMSLMENNGCKIIVHCTSVQDQEKRVNAAFLIGAFAIIVYRMSVSRIIRLLEYGRQIGYLEYTHTHARRRLNSINITIPLHAFLRAFELASFDLKIFAMNRFDVIEYENLAYNHGMSWIIPAFTGPTHNDDAYRCIEYFKYKNIRTVIRLNDVQYDKNIFLKNGIQHFDLFFPDLSAPQINIVKLFLKISETTNNAIAVHCKAGYGRTGSLIAAFLIKHYKMSAREAIAWIRICRPGSVVGVQQLFLESIEHWLKYEGSFFKHK